MKNNTIETKVITAQQMYFLCLILRPGAPVKAKNLTQYRCLSGGTVTTIQPFLISFSIAENGIDWELVDDKDNLWYRDGVLIDDKSTYTETLELETELSEREFHLVDFMVKSCADKAESQA
jgi:hypothetical protein